MKTITTLVPVIALMLLAACSGSVVKTTTTDASGQPVTTTTIDATKSKVAVATHADLLGAADAATKAAAATNDPALKAALTARAAKWLAGDTLLTAQEGQISACLNAIRAAAPVLPAGVSTTGPHVFTDIELAAEAVGNFTGISPAIKLACADLPIVPLPVIPKL